MKTSALLLPLLLGGCSSIFGIPSEGELGCPSPCTVSVTGRAVRAESVSADVLSSVTIRLATSPAMTVTTGPDGTFAFDDLPQNTPIAFDVSIPQSGSPDLQGLLDTRYLVGNATADVVVDIPVVQFAWLAQTAVDCGIFPDLNTALFEGNTTAVNSYFTTRTTVLGQVLEANGSPAALDRSDIAVLLGTFTNFQGNPQDLTNPPTTRVCFLEPDLDSGLYVGKDEDRSTSGRFIMFRARNDAGTGTAAGEVRIPSFPAGELNAASATIGFSKIQLGVGTPLPARIHTFERDVYHFFAEKTCSITCHRPGGIGYTTAPVRMGSDGMNYPADWSASVDQVFKALTLPTMTNCDDGVQADTARVCLVKPDKSLLYVNPAGLGNHQGIVLPADDAMLAAVLAWITDGATLR